MLKILKHEWLKIKGRWWFTNFSTNLWSFVSWTVATYGPSRNRPRLTSRKWRPWLRIGSASFTMRCDVTPAVCSEEIHMTFAYSVWPPSGLTTVLPQKSIRLWRLVEFSGDPFCIYVTGCAGRTICSDLVRCTGQKVGMDWCESCEAYITK